MNAAVLKRRILRAAVAAIATLGLAAAALAAPRPAPRPFARPSRQVLGFWHGTSDCVLKDGPCRDEIVQYRFVPITNAPDSLRLFADKRVDGRYERMGVLDCGYSPTTRSWSAEFHNARVDILWNYVLRDSELVGTLVDLPDRTLLRRARLTRGPGVVPHGSR